MLTTLAVHGYRSLRDVVVPLSALTVVTGANGVGKSNLYRAFRLLADVADGRLIGSLAAAGGLGSVLWAGPEHVSRAMRLGEVPVQGTGLRKAPVSLQLGFAADELGYLVDVGLPTATGAPGSSHPAGELFRRDPVLKREVVFAGPQARPASTLATRPPGLDPRSSILADLPGSEEHPELATLRRFLRSWRFHDAFRVDPLSPARQPQVITHTPSLSDDGHDVAAALLTIVGSAWAEPLQRAVADALQGAALDFLVDDVRGVVALRQPGMLRPIAASELSDGSLRFLMLAAALLSPTPPGLLVLNEPEASLHPDVLPALGRMIVAAAQRGQVVVVTHSASLVAALHGAEGSSHVELVKELGETLVRDQGLLDRPAWQWGRR